MIYDEYDSIEDLLCQGNNYLSNYALSLIQWDLGEDTYYLFVIKSITLERLIKLGTKFDIKFDVK